ncbi:MAG: hypothetical protein ACPGWR_16815 [Ardenticatenaceae bacterium]
MARVTQTEKFWREDFTITVADEIELQEYFFQKNTALHINDIVRLLMEWRLSGASPETEVSSNKYDPTSSYQTGQKMYFSSLDGAVGEVMTIRDGMNDRYGTFRVMQVYFPKRKETREFAIELNDFEVRGNGESQPALTPEDLYNRYGRYIRQSAELELGGSPNFVHLAEQWLPTIMLVNFHEGHCNIADAMIDIMGVPMSTAELLTEMPIPQHANREVKLFSLNYAFTKDKRFNNVGTDEQPLWFLPRLA